MSCQILLYSTRLGGEATSQKHAWKRSDVMKRVTRILSSLDVRGHRSGTPLGDTSLWSRTLCALPPQLRKNCNAAISHRFIQFGIVMILRLMMTSCCSSSPSSTFLWCLFLSNFAPKFVISRWKLSKSLSNAHANEIRRNFWRRNAIHKRLPNFTSACRISQALAKFYKRLQIENQHRIPSQLGIKILTQERRVMSDVGNDTR